MHKTSVLSKLRSKYARMTSPWYKWCSCVSVNEPEENERNYQTRAGRQAPSCQTHSQSEVILSRTGSVTEARAPSLGKSSAIHENLPSIGANEEQQDKKPATCSESVEGPLEATCVQPAVADPNTPVQLSPGPSRGLSQTSLESQESQTETATDAGTPSTPAAEPDHSPATSSIDSSLSSAISCSTKSVATSILSYGVATALNTRQYQEDRATAAIFNSSEHDRDFDRLGVAAVFDGHGGSQASEYLQQHFVPVLMQQLQLGVSPQEAVAAAVNQVEETLMSSECIAGSTLTAVVVLDDYLVVAQVGDSRAILCRGEGKPVQLTVDHKPSDVDERARITAADPTAEITSDGYCYGLGVSRGLGSHQIKSDTSKQAFTAAADITVHHLQLQDDFIVLGSDGVFDSLRNHEVATAARRALATANGDCSAAAQALVDRAISMGSTDNVTAVVLKLHDRKILLAKSNSRLFRNRE